MVLLREEEEVTGIRAKFLKANQIQDTWGFNGILAGHPGTGKTTLAATAQDSVYGRDVFVIDVDGGTRSIADRKDVTVFVPERFEEITEVYTFLENEEHSFKTIVIDTLTEMQKLGLKSIMAGQGELTPSLQDYGKSNEQITGLIRAFRKFAYTKGWSVIFVTHLKEFKDERTGAVVIRSALTPAASESACAIVDCVAVLHASDNSKRVLQFEANSTAFAKIRQPLGVVGVPKEMENPTMDKVLRAMRGENVNEVLKTD